MTTWLLLRKGGTRMAQPVHGRIVESISDNCLAIVGGEVGFKLTDSLDEVNCWLHYRRPYEIHVKDPSA